MNKPEILILDDDLIVRTLLKKELSPHYAINDFSNGRAAISFLKNNIIDIALLDIDLGAGMNGLEVLKELLRIDSELSIIMISSMCEIDTIVSSIKYGAFDFAPKPIDISKLKFRIKKALEFNKLKGIVDRYNNLKDRADSVNAIIGSSQETIKCKRLIKNAGPMRLLLLGETGVGKTPFARYSNFLLAKESDGERPFEQINCANLKRERFVDELFGHVKGAYTGAISEKKGMVELAEGGDLFLDEIGDLDLECQGELLTYLDNYEYFKLGGTKKLKSRIRIISATNKDLKKMITDGKFRKDLYSRLAQCVVEAPPLRTRKKDICELIKHFVVIFTGYEKPVNESVIKQLEKFDWEEGNVRDLKNACEYMCMVSKDSPSIEPEHIPGTYSCTDTERIKPNILPEFDPSLIYNAGYEKFIETIEYNILSVLFKEQPGVKALSEKLKINRMTLNRKLIKLNLK